MDFPGDSDGKGSTCNARFLGSGRSPGEGQGNPSPGNSHGQRSLAGYSLWGPKELDTIE